MSDWIDVSRPLSPRTASWPGDVGYSKSMTMRQASGDSVNVGAIHCSLHMATHVDAPSHVNSDAATIEALSPDIFVGACEVVDVRGIPSISAADIRVRRRADSPRLLLQTGGWPDPAIFPRSIPVMADDVPDYLGASGIVLIGLDVPSVDAIDSRELPIHHALQMRQIHILESLDLSQVLPGQFDLIALPLRIVEGDASPVRAVLRPHNVGEA